MGDLYDLQSLLSKTPVGPVSKFPYSTVYSILCLKSFNNDVKTVHLWSPVSQLRDTKTDDTIIFKNPITCTPAPAARGHGTLRHRHIGNCPLGASLAHPPNGIVSGDPQPFLLVNICNVHKITFYKIHL